MRHAPRIKAELYTAGFDLGPHDEVIVIVKQANHLEFIRIDGSNEEIEP